MGLIYCVRWWDNVNKLKIRGIQLVSFVALSLRMMVDLSIDQLQTADVSISKASSTIKVMIRQYVLLSYKPLTC